MIHIKYIPGFIILKCLFVFAQHPGDLDTTFGVNGWVTTDIQSGSPDYGNSIVAQLDGKIVVAGGGGFYDFALVRYNQDGALDNSFGIDGIVTTDFTGYDWANSIKIQNDEKLVVVGSHWSEFWVDIAMARYNNDGSLDVDFGFGGLVQTDVYSIDEANSVAIQSDGKIVVAGYCCYPSNFAIVRYTTYGSLDTSFGIDGKVITDIYTYEDYGYSVAIQPDEKIIVAGYSWNGTNRDFSVVRYDYNGAVDSSFGADGIVTTDANGNHDEGRAVAIQSDGKIIVAGYTWGEDASDFLLVRFNTDGTLDSNFGIGGIVTTDINSASNMCYSLAIQSDEKIVAAGYTSGPNFTIVRYNTDGSPDTGFGNSGIVTTTIGTAEDIAIQSDGKIVVVGWKVGDIVVARYLGIISPIQVLSPNGGEIWYIGEEKIVRWISEDIDSVKIQLSIDNGLNWNLITESTPSDGVYEWIVQSSQSSQHCIIKITDVADSTIYDDSDTTFIIDSFSNIEDSLDRFSSMTFRLFSNYPNPFNPSSVISWQSPVGSWQTLKVYDVLGNEVATLINEEKPAGSYKVEFNGTGLPSGIYFYQLKAGSYVETKKMVLLR